MKKFEELERQDQENVMNAYYSGASEKEIRENFNISERLSSLVKKFPPEPMDEACVYCGAHIVAKRRARSSIQGIEPKDLFCLNCGHKPHPPYWQECNCAGCKNGRENLRRRRIANIEETYLGEIPPVDYAELGVWTKVTVGAICSFFSHGENSITLETIKPQPELSPSIAVDEIVIRKALGSNALRIHQDSPIAAFSFAGERPIEFDISLLKYRLNIPEAQKEIAMYPEFSLKEKKRALYFLRLILVQECIQFLKYKVKPHNIAPTEFNRTEALFETLIDRFSVSQIFYIVSTSVMSRVQIFKENSYSKKGLYTAIINNIEKRADCILTDGWHVREFGRDRNLPQTAISWFLAYRALGVGEATFKKPFPLIEKLVIEDGNAPGVENIHLQRVDEELPDE